MKAFFTFSINGHYCIIGLRVDAREDKSMNDLYNVA